MKAAALALPVFLAACPLASAVRINEFLADNTSTTLSDEDGDTPDWIELHNPSGSPASLAGLYLTDDPGDPTKWPCPAVTISPNGYLVVFASGKDRSPTNGDPLHTNFALAQEGEHVALVDSDGATVLSEFGPGGTNYPNQRAGISYGYFGSPEEVGFLFNPTPGARNDDSTAVLGFVADTKFDIDRGFHDAPFHVTITSATPDAVIRYTTDGSWPGESDGTPYTGPILVDRSMPLKAIATKPGFVPSNVDTQTYLFADDIVTQTSATTRSVWGFPSSWLGTSPYYGMDGNPRINPIAHSSIREDLKLVPSLSVAMDLDDLFGSSGIYSNPQSSGVSWERWTSLEFIDPAHPDGSNNFQQNCAIRIQGGAFRSFGLTRKKSFRVLFKSEWGTQGLPTGGPGTLNFPLFGPDAASEFQTLVFRMEANDGWQWSAAGAQPQYARDEFGRRAQLALGQAASHGRHCHLYLNGVYWGIYNVAERPDSGFAESYFGATRETWQGQNSGNPINDATSLQDWSTMLGAVDDVSAAPSDLLRDREYLQACGFDATGKRDSRLTVWIDPVNFADYLLVNWYGGNSDWPHKNYYCGRSRDAGSTGFKFFMWDAEWSLLLRSDLNTNRTSTFSGVAAPQQHLERSPEYRVLFGDRAHRALFNDGVFTPAKAIALYDEITAQHLRILNPEAARWGNQHGGAHDVRDWQTEQRNVVHPSLGWLGRRGPILVSQLRARDLYPDLDAPVFSPHGGSVPAGNGPVLSVPDDITKIYYVYGNAEADPAQYGHPLDPRLVGGGVNPAATLIDFGAPGDGTGTHTSAPLALNGPGFLHARAYDSSTGEWSALNTALFTLDTVPADAGNLVVSEIHYHPAAPGAAEVAAGFGNQDLFEFLEIQNISASNVDLSGVEFIDGIEFAFSPGFTLAAGARAVIVKDLAAFQFRYPGFPPEQIAGTFQNDSNLRNSGERLALRGANSDLIRDFAYDDEPPWPGDPDGVTGVSLVLIAPATNPDHSLAQNWRPASAPGGNPGGHDALAFDGLAEDDFDGDGLLALVEHAAGTSDDDPADRAILTLRVEEVEVDGVAGRYFTLAFPVELRAEDVEVVPQLSANLIDWESGPAELVALSAEPLGGTRVLLTYRSSLPVEDAREFFVRLLVRPREAP